MSDTAHVLEEMRSLRGAHADLLSEMSQLCAQVRELVIELRHTQRDTESFKKKMEGMEEDIRALQLESALNKPILDIARAINTKMWMAILFSAIAVSAQAIDWSKFGG